MKKQIGVINKKVIELLNLGINENTPVFIGKGNENHIKQKHPKDYKKYFKYISVIINNPDYVGINKKNNSIEYVKEFKLNNDYVKVAVRVSTKGAMFARTLYTLNHNRVENFIKKGTLKKV